MIFESRLPMNAATLLRISQFFLVGGLTHGGCAVSFSRDVSNDASIFEDLLDDINCDPVAEPTPSPIATEKWVSNDFQEFVLDDDELIGPVDQKTSSILPTSAPTESIQETGEHNTEAPSMIGPTHLPSLSPTEIMLGSNDGPSASPSVATATPSVAPSFRPSLRPSHISSRVPSSQPTNKCHMYPTDRENEIRLELDAIVDGGTLDDHSSSQYLAFNWLVHDDGRQVCPDDYHMVQRFVIALLYFETNGDGWLNCARNLTSACSSDNGTPSVRFLDELHECSWHGITCDALNRITDISLDGNNMKGKVPNEVSNLHHLSRLMMDSNELEGTIPSSLGSLTFLKVIDLDKNRLIGTIPGEIFQIQTLSTLDLDTNSLTGTISAQIGNLANLFMIQIDFNQFHGTIPTEVASLEKLRYFTAVGNNFIGSLPEAMCSLDQLTIYANCDMCTIDGCCTQCL